MGIFLEANTKDLPMGIFFGGEYKGYAYKNVPAGKYKGFHYEIIFKRCGSWDLGSWDLDLDPETGIH